MKRIKILNYFKIQKIQIKYKNKLQILKDFSIKTLYNDKDYAAEEDKYQLKRLD